MQVSVYSKMPKLDTPPSIGESDPALLHMLAPIKRVCLAAVGIIAGGTLFVWFFPALGNFLHGSWRLMTATTALGLLLNALSLEFSESRYTIRTCRISQVLAILAALVGITILAEYAFYLSGGIERLLPFDPKSTSPWPDRPAPQTAAGLALLGITSVLIRVRARVVVRIADLVAICLGLLVLVLVSGEIFGAMRFSGISSITRTSPQTMACLALLTLTAFLRRAEVGIFSIFLGRGIGSRIARTFAPVLLVLPFLREISRAHMMQAHRIPEQYATAILASLATMLAFVLLLILAWRINSMEKEIHDLSLRDELTGLYNLRGFNLLAEQALRLARRSQAQFSVLYIDLDNLKAINDSLGHSAGSAYLAETADLLKETFREADVMGRIGGDEFAVVCQCSHVAISIAAQRLRAGSAVRNSKASRRFPLCFSIGYVTAEEHAHQSLKELLTQADTAMYEEKRHKKLSRA
jgi:diguanylate cyclase (GGDEF)-like protein